MMSKIDPNEAPEGYVAVKETFVCRGCALTYLDGDCLAADCAESNRKDGCNVIFVKRDGKATASWPYDSEGTPVEVPHA